MIGVRQKLHLVELVRDVENADARRLQSPDEIEQLLLLALRQRARRLIEDQESRASRHGLGDFDHLTGPDAERRAEVVRGQIKLKLAEHVFRLRIHLGPANHAVRSHRLAPEKDVLRDIEIRNDRQLLMDHGDAIAQGVPRRSEMDFLAVDEETTGVRLIHSAQDVHERRLAGAIVADDCVDRPRLDRQVDAPQRSDHRRTTL